MSESTEEIDVVIRQLNSFMDKLRGHDTGGDDGKQIYFWFLYIFVLRCLVFE